jgi:hypothetical protein
MLLCIAANVKVLSTKTMPDGCFVMVQQVASEVSPSVYHAP